MSCQEYILALPISFAKTYEGPKEVTVRLDLRDISKFLDVDYGGIWKSFVARQERIEEASDGKWAEVLWVSSSLGLHSMFRVSTG